MEWVETTGRTVEEAKSVALDRLGIHEEDAEIEVLEEPRVGLFGRQRGEARVRARVRPSTPRPKVERRDRRKKGAGKDSDGASTDVVPATSTELEPAPRAPRAPKPQGKSSGKQSTGQRSSRPPRAVAEAGSESSAAPAPSTQRTDVDATQVGEEATRFVSALVAAFGLEGETTVEVDGDEIDVRVNGTDLGLLVGPRGTTLQAVQELTRVVAQRRLGDHDTHLRVDVGGYRERRREALGRFARQIADQVVADGVARRLEPMSSADRKIVHDALHGLEGVVTSSVGDDPHRQVVISPANG